jgi:hypothetical protein
MAINQKEKLRKVKNLMYIHPLTWNQPSDRKVIFELYEKHKNDLYKSKQWWGRITELINLYKLIDELGLTEQEINEMWYNISRNQAKQKAEYNKRPQKEGRDNKDVHVGSGNSSNNNTVRYPSKKRSIRTWKKFYNLFPYYAVLDGWDGKTSKRMK